MADILGLLDTVEMEQTRDSVQKLPVKDIQSDDVDSKSYESSPLNIGRPDAHSVETKFSVDLIHGTCKNTGSSDNQNVERKASAELAQTTLNVEGPDDHNLESKSSTELNQTSLNSGSVDDRSVERKVSDELAQTTPNTENYEDHNLERKSSTELTQTSLNSGSVDDHELAQRTSLNAGSTGGHTMERKSSIEMVQYVKEEFKRTKPLKKKPSLASRLKKVFTGKSNEHNSSERDVIVEYVPEVDAEPKTKPDDTSELRRYKMDFNFPGRLLLIDEERFEFHQDLSDRDGSNLDSDKVYKVFRKIGFKKDHIEVLKNRRFSEIMEKLDSAAKMDYTDYGMFVCVVLTHGESGHLHAADKLFPIECLWRPFAEENCPSLKGKPKVFIIQACRGTHLDAGVNVEDPKVKQKKGDRVDGITNDSDLSNSSSPTSSVSDFGSLDTQHVPNFKTHNRHRSESGISFCVAPPASEERRPSGSSTVQLMIPPPATDVRRPSLPNYGLKELLMPQPPSSEVRRTSLPIDDLKAQLMIPNPQVRRSSFDQVDATPTNHIRLNSPHKIPDMLVAYSTIDGYYSFRRPTSGSWFIQTVFEKLEEFYKIEDLMSIMTRASCYIATDMMSYVSDRSRSEFHQKKQVPCIVSTFTKLLYFPKRT